MASNGKGLNYSSYITPGYSGALGNLMRGLIKSKDNKDYFPHDEPAEEPKARGGPVELVTLFASASIQKDYGTHVIIYEGKFRKLMPGARGETLVPTSDEIAAFIKDVAKAAKNDRKIAEFVKANPDLMLN